MAKKSPADAGYGAQVGATLAVMAAACLFGTLPFFARTLSEHGLAPQAISFWRFVLSALVLTPFVIFGRPQPRPLLWALAGGAAMGLGWIGFVTALRELSVAETGILFMTFPLFAILIGWLLFGERPQFWGVIAGLLIMAAALAVAPPGRWAGNLGAALGHALLAPAAYGFLLNIVARKLSALRPPAAAGAVALGSVMVVAPLLAGLQMDEVLPHSADAWGWLLLFSGATALLPQLLVVMFAAKIGATRTAIAGSLELPAMFLVGTLALGETLAPHHLFAAVLILLAIVLSARPSHDAQAFSRSGP
ncbi:MAG: DMT family transporter [Pseudomonadota bacterium]